MYLLHWIETHMINMRSTCLKNSNKIFLFLMAEIYQENVL